MEGTEQRIRELVKQNAFTVYNHIELAEVAPDYAVFELEIGPNSTNGYGRVHGGALFALADNATGCAIHTDGRHYVTQTGTLHFLANQSQGVIQAVARVRHRGRKTALASVEITGEDGKLLATGEYLYYCINQDA